MGIETAVDAVLVPSEEIDTDKVDSKVVIVLEESVDIFFHSRMSGNRPLEPPIVVDIGIHHRIGRAISQGAHSDSVGSGNHEAVGTVNPHRIVVHSKFQAVLTALSHQVGKQTTRHVGGEIGIKTSGIVIGMPAGTNPEHLGHP